MKKIIYTLITSFILVACGGGSNPSVDKLLKDKNLDKIRQKRTEILSQYDALGEDLRKLDEAIGELDTLQKIPLVTAITVGDTIFKHYIDLQGNIETNQNIIIYPEYSGVLTKVLVREGQKVSKGQTLAIIDDGGLRQQLQQLEAQAELAKTTFDRQKRLWEQKIGSEIQYLQAKTSMESQSKLAEQLKSQLAKTVVKASFSGVIDDVITDQGQVVMSGQSQLFRLVNLDEMYVKADIPENYLSNVAVNSDVQIEIPSLGKNYVGKVRQVGSFINPNNRSFSVEISIPNPDKLLRPNQIAKLLINDYTNPNGILIPENIIKENSLSQKIAYVIFDTDAQNEATVTEVQLELGYTSGTFVEIISGLKVGQKIVAEGSKNIEDQQKVKIVQ
ncbi:MAG: efflux RND transporter periplasmic adaptor subunit [Flavobacteriaceae bacterium]|nr:efflux RND transporter periplasmic adaptor subunit [Flavobacteriaceae bacterium]MDZ4146955.1 efflux RND transporter periplasmic adaptor subunit [Flavobacteriaceae bacterium]